MRAVTIRESRSIEAVAFNSGWTGEQLLNLAGERLGIAIGRHFPDPGTAIGYLGKGNNAGDTLVALRILRDRFGWKIGTRNAFSFDDCTPLFLKKWDELGIPFPLDRLPDRFQFEGPLLLLDGLLGTGSSGPPRGQAASLAGEMNHLRATIGARIAAVDIPSGTDADSGEIFSGSVTADITFMIGNAKRGLLQSRATDAAGALSLVSVPPLDAPGGGDFSLICPQTCCFGKSPRPFDFHKGRAGRVAIVAGSSSYPGAAALAASGALRGGVGLVTLFVPTAALALITSRCPPETIVRSYENPSEILNHRFDALAIGCGLGEIDDESFNGLLELISKSTAPTVIDADALNHIARSGKSAVFSSNHLLTPHPGEFARLAPDLGELPREEAARHYADRIPATLLLKGSRTLVTRAGLPLMVNSTGSPGMATGGQGDLLAGVIAARLAIGDELPDAAALGAWLCGRAAEIALQTDDLSEESLLPSDVLRFLGAAFRDWRESSR
jgi:ADP-dependent NAD(P)H-hydrate dehydratase / NAD(P)H-hydrate epimerase